MTQLPRLGMGRPSSRASTSSEGPREANLHPAEFLLRLHRCLASAAQQSHRLGPLPEHCRQETQSAKVPALVVTSPCLLLSHCQIPIGQASQIPAQSPWGKTGVGAAKEKTITQVGGCPAWALFAHWRNWRLRETLVRNNAGLVEWSVCGPSSPFSCGLTQSL